MLVFVFSLWKYNIVLCQTLDWGTINMLDYVKLEQLVFYYDIGCAL